MATPFLSTANTFLSSTTLSSSSSSSLVGLHKPHQTLCKAFSTESPSISPTEITKRSLSISFITGLVFTLAGNGGHVDANAAILEADDDDELMEKVKKDRKKRLERQGVINSSKQETGYLQDLVFKLSKVGQAIENKDLSTANSVLGGSTDTDWVQRANIAFTKLSSGRPEEKTEVDTFNSSLASLISSVTRNDIESSKIAFVASARKEGDFEIDILFCLYEL
ncbi:hypothetical protein Q3G72_004155 [Acer saccharum]|nr:hypothetical protein Q3G72_004155 [Acer saccharum]